MLQKTKPQGKSPGDLAAMREAFLRAASDRLKTPVTTLGLALQRLEEVQTEEERKRFLQMALRGQREMKQAVEEVLETARGKIRQEEEP
nr:histidine kinase dimerization/phospho-acceptor domain-containing protein [uncultured Eisenbergiella sp.]